MSIKPQTTPERKTISEVESENTKPQWTPKEPPQPEEVTPTITNIWTGMKE